MNVVLETERLIIREPVLEDFEPLWKMRNDGDVTKFTGGITKLSRDEMYERHAKRCANFDSKPKEYSVVLKGSGEYIGYCGFQYCGVLDGIEILYGYAKEYWGYGYASEAAKVVLEHGIKELQMKQIVAAVNKDNIASDKVLTKIGMEYVGDVEWPGQGMVKTYEIKDVKN